MLGEQIGELRGKRTGRRVLTTDGGVKVEVSFEDDGKVLGVDVHDIGTYWAVVRPDGNLYGEGDGLFMGSGGEMATWKGQGLGKFGAGGAVSYRGALYFSSASPKLERLNNVVGAYEYEVDAQGNTHTKFWEWK
jgi:hypothetical protein